MKNVLIQPSDDILRDIRSILEGSATKELNPKEMDDDLDGVPSSTSAGDKPHETEKHPLAPEASHLDPDWAEKQIKEEQLEVVPENQHPSFNPSSEHDAKQMLLEPEKDLDEVAPADQEKFVKAAKAHFKQQYGDRWQEVLYATANKRHNEEKLQEKYVEGEKSMLDVSKAQKEVDNDPAKSDEVKIIAPEASHLDPNAAEKKLHEDDDSRTEVNKEAEKEKEENSDADHLHGKVSSGKVANLDGIAREETIREELDQGLDQQSGMPSPCHRDFRPKHAEIVMEEGFDISGIHVKGYRLALSFVQGGKQIFPEVSQPALKDLAEMWEFINKNFSDRPEWQIAIEEALLDVH